MRTDDSTSNQRTSMCAVYLWRRNVITIRLGDGLGRFLRSTF